MSRELKEGDWLVVVHLVDLAVSISTLGVPFLDPQHPYSYQVLGGKKQIRFCFDQNSTIEGVGRASSMMKAWPHAEDYTAPLSLIAICKRTIWERRNLIRQTNEQDHPSLQELAPNVRLVDSVKVASIAYALGFKKPAQHIVTHNYQGEFLVNTVVPEWLAPYCPTFDDLLSQIEQGIPFIEAEGNETHPVAVACAVYMNIVAWLEHLRTDKPFVQFKTATGKQYWVKEGSEKWREFLDLGYEPV